MAFVDPDESKFTDPEGAKPALNVLQRRMGLGHKGDTAAKIADTVGSAGYELGGAATDLAAKVLPPEGAALVGTAANLAPDVAATALSGGLGAAAKAPAAARAIMQSALKPIQSQIASGKFERARDTLLKEGIPATRAGVEKMRGLIDGLDQQVSEIVKASKGTLTTDAVMERLLPVYERYLTQPSGMSEVGPAVKVAQEMRAHPLVGDEMSVQAAQAMKEGGYRKLGDKGYGLGLQPEAERDALKAVNRGLKEEIERVHPEVAPLNARESELINAMKITARRTGMEANKNMAGLGWLVHGGPTSPWYWAWLAERSPAVKSALAQGLYTGNLGRNLGAMTGAGAGYGLGTEQPQRPVTLQDILEAQQR